MIETTNGGTVRTTDLLLASFWLVRGLPLVEVNAIDDSRGYCSLIFRDPEQREAALTVEFNHDYLLHSFARARRDLSAAIAIAKGVPERRCPRARLDAALRERRLNRTAERRA